METVDATTAILAGAIVIGGGAIGKAMVDHVAYSRQRTGTQPMEVYEDESFGEGLMKAAAAFTAMGLFVHQVGEWLKP
jgi:hypothetical protein